MTYLLLCGVFLLIAGAAALLLCRGRRGLSSAVPAITAAVLAVLTAVFDNLMIAAGLFAYADEHISGLRIGLAPVEDFAYPLAAVILLPALWARLRPSDAPPTSDTGEAR
ncbi:lycopene cyclase domain-containing protein [Microbacterium sp. YJN-G]|uniref:lycopene cyclase domain-containing protein n=1 Tax=Microbacterium sp. YJN-G TaxID=2763257 RepID=UPI001878EEDE|nr:lycopene cyclase domain-containing protein [Microbacterium sp. YJN-G]